MNKQQVKGHLNEVKGTVKEAAGDLVGNTKLEVKGKVQKNLGKLQVAQGDLKEAVKSELHAVSK